MLSRTVLVMVSVSRVSCDLPFEYFRKLMCPCEFTAHESPYLHKGNIDTLLQAGMTFTSEPGIYLVDKFGVRHEDVLLVRDDAEPILLTGRRAMGPWDP